MSISATGILWDPGSTNMTLSSFPVSPLKPKEAVNAVQTQALFLVPQVIEASLSCLT